MRGVQLFQVNSDKPDTDTDIDIIAVHGLDTKSPDTWTWRPPRTPKENHVNWLQDKHMLPATEKRARIFTCDWPAGLLYPSDLVQKTIDEYALLLLDGIHRRPLATNAAGEERPIFFIASCLGGLILMKALVHADDKRSDYYRTRRATRGIVFLATPFRGTSFQDVAAWAEPSLEAWATVRGQERSRLLDSVKESTFDLEALVRRFTQLCGDDDSPCAVFNFYELGKTNLPRKVFPWSPARFSKQLVDRSSATLDMVPHPLPLDRHHVLTNKFASPECPDYEKVAGKIKEMLQKIREGSPLNQADAWIREKHYTTDRLQIERLSGDQLPMDQCYINLAILEQPRGGTTTTASTSSTHHPGGDSEGEDDIPPQSSPFSLRSRLKAEIPDNSTQVELLEIFKSRQRGDAEMKPSRILIRGRAGVGKTTLCKKIVHDFIHHGAWADLFDRVLWVPLRKLKTRSAAGYDLQKLFYDEYFYNSRPNDGDNLAAALSRGICDERTLFILDGLDEVSDLLDPDHAMFGFLEWLLNQHKVVITSRPHARLPAVVTAPDLELETIGFYPNQVKEYLQKSFADPEDARKIRSFLQEHQLMQGLVRIPVQLDALCFTWNEAFESATKQGTMTGVYQAIEQRLWKKDIPRLNTKHNGEPVTRTHIESASQHQIEALAKQEIFLLEGLAFTGMHDDLVEFEPNLLGAAFHCFTSGLLLPDKTLPCLSFLRTSDPSSENGRRSCHFIHLTYQEYFAARYFVRQWRASPPGTLIFASRNAKGDAGLPIEYLRRHKYTARYDILWRFVAGLFGVEGKAKEFFDVIEEEPLDLLGPMHQRLVMHCLAEVQSEAGSKFAPLQTKLEDRLAEWVLFECRYRKESSLAREMELPPTVLNRAFQEATEEERLLLTGALKTRHSVPKAVADLLASWLGAHAQTAAGRDISIILCRDSMPPDEVEARLDSDDRHIRKAAIKALATREQLPAEVLTRVVARLDHTSDWDLQAAAIEVLSTREQVPTEILMQVEARLDSDWETRHAAVEVLAKCKQLPAEVLTRVVARLDYARDWDLQDAAVEVLSTREQVPTEILMQVEVRLGHDDWRIQNAAVKVLATLEQLPAEVLTRVAARPNVSMLLAIEKASNAAIRLGHYDQKVRETALKAFAIDDELPDDILMKVVALLKSSDWKVREAGVKAFATRKQLPTRILSEVVELLHHEDSEVSRTAVKALAICEELPAEILIQIEARLNHATNESVRETAAEVLATRKQLPAEVLRRVAARLDACDPEVRLLAVTALTKCELPENILARLAAQLVHPNTNLRQWAIYSLAIRKQLPAKILQEVLYRLDDSKYYIREAAVEALARREHLPDEILTKLAAGLDDRHEIVREAAVEALAIHEQLPDEILTKLAAGLNDRHEIVRLAAVTALAERKQLPPEILRLIELRLSDHVPGVREAAVEALARREQLPPSVLGRVTALLRSNCDWNTQRAAAKAVARHEQLPAHIFAKVVARLDDKDFILRHNAIETLAIYKQLSPEILKLVAARLSDFDWEVRKAAIDMLTSRGQLPSEVIRQVVAQLKTGSRTTAAAAAEVLATCKQLPAEVISWVVADSNGYVRYQMVRTLSTCEELPADVLMLLATLLNHYETIIRQAAVDSLVSQRKLPVEIIGTHLLKGLYTSLLERAWTGDVCWATATHESFLQVDQSAPVVWTGWTETLTCETREVGVGLGVPQ